MPPQPPLPIMGEGGAIAEQLKVLPARGLPPVLVLMSDGMPTDDFSAGLLAGADGRAVGHDMKAVRVAIAIGEDADLEILQKFIGHPELKPLQANNPEALVGHIKWVSTPVLQSASSPASQTTDFTPTTNVPIPVVPTAGISSASDVW